MNLLGGVGVIRTEPGLPDGVPPTTKEGATDGNATDERGRA